MEKNVINLDFHQTFKPERTCLSSLLTEIPECSGKTPQEISKVTGIPTGARSGKVVPSIIYMNYMGLLSYKADGQKYTLSYTDLGSCVVNEDPGLTEDLTILLLHCMITRKHAGASLWHFVISDLMPKYHNEISKVHFEKEVELNYGKKVNISPFNGAYSGLFEQINILKAQNDGYKLKPHLYNADFIYLYSYILYESWEDWIAGLSDSERESKKVSDSEITAIYLEETGFRLPFGWTDKEEYQVLEAMHDKGIISLNRQMTPFSIRRLLSKKEIIGLLYSELC